MRERVGRNAKGIVSRNVVQVDEDNMRNPKRERERELAPERDTIISENGIEKKKRKKN